MLLRWGKGRGGEGAPASRRERNREGGGEADGSIFQAPRPKKLEQETGKGLPSIRSGSVAVVLVFTQKLRFLCGRENAL